MLKKHFQRVDIYGKYIAKDKSILLIGNHISWWDGFFAFHLNRKIFHKDAHVMMLREQLIKRKFLSKIGAFSIDPGKRNMINSIQYGNNILKNPKNLLLLFPQGEIRSMHQHQLMFEEGWIKILNKIDQDVQIIFMVNLIDYFSNRKPILSIYFKKISEERNITIDFLQSSYNEFLKECIDSQSE